ncbi:hypothetical protein [Geoanaerobacter pelophilus]|nr:hypothetical protein [Geoanaerobacter pelophilus]
MLKRILKHLAARREWNRTKRLLNDRARSRCLVSLLYANGVLRQI